jgi:hypothetical protein
VLARLSQALTPCLAGSMNTKEPLQIHVARPDTCRGALWAATLRRASPQIHAATGLRAAGSAVSSRCRCAAHHCALHRSGDEAAWCNPADSPRPARYLSGCSLGGNLATPIPSDSCSYRPWAAGSAMSSRCRCAAHHRALHPSGDEAAWWKSTGLDPVTIAQRLWQHTRLNGAPIQMRIDPLLGPSMVQAGTEQSMGPARS